MGLTDCHVLVNFTHRVRPRMAVKPIWASKHHEATPGGVGNKSSKTVAGCDNTVGISTLHEVGLQNRPLHQFLVEHVPQGCQPLVGPDQHPIGHRLA